MTILQNFVTGNGSVYCHLNRKVAKLVELPCTECPYFYGTLQGHGRECKVGEGDDLVRIEDPHQADDQIQTAGLGSLPDTSEET